MSTARAEIEAEMIRELIARRAALTRAKETLLKATTEIQDIDGKLAVIAEELTAYGYVEPVIVGVMGSAGTTPQQAG